VHLDQGDQHLDKGHGHHEHAHAPHESPLSMTGVLWILAFLSIIGGFVGVPAILGGAHPTTFQHWLEPVLLPIGGQQFHFHQAPHALEWALMILSVAIASAGIFVAYRFYDRDPAWNAPKRLATRFALLYQLLEHKYYVDEIYDAVFVRATVVFSNFLWWFDRNVVDGLVNLTRHVTVYPLGHGSSLFDRYIVDGLVNGVGWSAQGGSALLRRAQSGLVQNYALIMGGGIILLAAVYLFLKP
jgi:NADH-quinone oxidoreductase subunit L